jgi:ubiquinone/menaquinone biosynthesis C-methylase UbiE
MTQNPFDKIYIDLLKEKNSLNKRIRLRRKVRKPFLKLLALYSRKINKPKVLEIACGTALDSYMLAQKIDGKSFASDISEKSISLAKQWSKFFKKKIKLSLQDAKKTSYKDGYFDVIFSQGFLEHFKNPTPYIKEQIRILKPGGYLIIDVPQKYNIYTLYKHLMLFLKKYPFGWETQFAPEDFKRIEKKFNIKLTQLFGWDDGTFEYQPPFVIKPFFELYKFIYKKVLRLLGDKRYYLTMNIMAVYQKL